VACDGGSRLAAYDVHTRRPADVILWTAALDRHQMMFGRAPDLTTAYRGRVRAVGRVEGLIAHRIGLPVGRVCVSGYSYSVHPVLR
jgi:hypothetical protein